MERPAFALAPIRHHGPMPSLPHRDVVPWTRRQRRVAGGVGAIVVAMAAGAIAWAETHQGGYGESANGCVNVLAPSTMGGGVLHRCGEDARTWCRAEYAASDRLAQLVQPQCRLAGITPDPSPVAGPP
jgi:hypothetical protein